MALSLTLMPSEKDNILEFKQNMKSDKMSHINYADIESLIKKIDGCANNPEKYSVEIGVHIPPGYSMSKICRFDHIEIKHTFYRGKDCKKKFCTSLREHAKNIIDFEKKKNVPVNKRITKIILIRKSMLYLRKKILKKFGKDKSY